MNAILSTRITLPLLIAITLLPVLAAAGEKSQSGSTANASNASSEKPGVATKKWIPLAQRSAPFRITAGPDKGTRFLCTFSPLDLDATGDYWQMKMGERRRTWLRRDPDGRLGVVKQVVPDEDAQVVYVPPATLLPARAVEGEVMEEEGEVTIYDLDGEERAAGTYTQEIEYLGRVKVRTPAGEFEGRRLRVLQRMDTTLANVRVVMDMVLTPGTGRVYQHTTRHTEKLGFFEETGVEEIQRAEKR